MTGASSGIGRATALYLASQDMQVFVACRRLADGEALARGFSDGRIVPVEMDVTLPETILQARAAVEDVLGAGGLDGLVNNAGIGFSAPMEVVSLARVRDAFEVNLFGQLEVIQAFLPLLRPGPGRIINLGSVGAHITIPFGGVLCATKAAFTSFNDALRQELHSSGIRVCLIEPGSIHTPAVEKTLGGPDEAIASWPAGAAERYGDMFRRFTHSALARENAGSQPDVVARAIYHALSSKRPKARYPVGKDARLLVTLPRVLSTSMLDGLRRHLFGMPTRFGGCSPSKGNIND
ncbi:SDR family oxidoreductase [Acidisoma silvae]|uniref:SDR family oxidoreductase n=1 Tax=Acidisoma silvae TaxID=2802396 RepID=A0A963YX70_9PROT|nr:SDR family oxidoreductase [Acidisoma silvae]